MSNSLHEQIEAVESGYEFLLAYVAIVNETFATKFFQSTENAIGRRFGNLDQRYAGAFEIGLQRLYLLDDRHIAGSTLGNLTHEYKNGTYIKRSTNYQYRFNDPILSDCHWWLERKGGSHPYDIEYNTIRALWQE